MAAVRAHQGDGTGLTTTKAPFIEQAQQEGRLYIHQPYELYSEANHDAWSKLFARMEDRWRRYANPRFLQGIDSLCLEPTRVPRLEDVNRFLSPLTGFKAKAVSGYIPSFLFFDSLRNREFPTTITIRDGASLDYLPEPDIFHDIAGHVPMHTDRAFADTLVRFGDCAHTAAEIVAGIRDEKEKIRRVTSIFKRSTQLIRRDRSFDRCAGGPAVPDSAGMGDQPVLRDRPLSALVVHRGLVRPSLRARWGAGALDARGQIGQRIAR
jgi:phenylalanine-4-hydroxylase